MEYIHIFERSEFWALIGVTLGFTLNVLWQFFRSLINRRRKQKSIESEIGTNKGLIPQKIDHLKNIQHALEDKEIIPGDNVHFSSYLYDNHIGEIGQFLSTDQREVLHVIYGSMKIVDRFLDNLFSNFIEAKSSGQFQQPFSAYSIMCSGLIERCQLIEKFIEEYLNGEYRKVTWENLNPKVVKTKE